LLLVLAVLLVGLYVTAFLSGREISFWPPRIGGKPQGERAVSATGADIEPSGPSAWKANSREVNDPAEWRLAAELSIGVMYSPRFLKDFHDVLRSRSESHRPTSILVIDPKSVAAGFLEQSSSSTARISESIEEVRHLIRELDGDRNCIRLRFH